jgi:hypothetical protein
VRTGLLLPLTFVASCGAWYLGVRAELRSIRPAGPTLAEHLAQRRAPVKRRVIVVGGQEYLALVGPVQAITRVPSGSPVYVFDRAGRLADWTADDGDDEAFKGRWGVVHGGRPVTPEEVEAWPGAGP